MLWFCHSGLAVYFIFHKQEQLAALHDASAAADGWALLQQRRGQKQTERAVLQQAQATTPAPALSFLAKAAK